MAAKAATRWANAGVKARAEQKRTASANPPQRSSSGGNNRRAVLLSGASLLSLCEVPQQAIGDDKPPPSEYTGAASPPALRDRRKERDEVDRGVYQPRRNYSNYKPRGEGETRFAYEKLSPEETEKRASESIERIRNKVPELVEKKYWQVRFFLCPNPIPFLRFALLTADMGYMCGHLAH